MVRVRDRGKYLTTSCLEGGRHKDKVNGGGDTRVGKVGRVMNDLGEGKEVGNSMDLVQERRGNKIVHIEITKENKILRREVWKRWKNGKDAEQIV